jgi:hypothetical protein
MGLDDEAAAVGVDQRVTLALVMADRERVGRDASPSVAIIDSQSVKTTEAGAPRGYDAGKKVNGRVVYPFKAPVVAPGGEPAVDRPPRRPGGAGSRQRTVKAR